MPSTIIPKRYLNTSHLINGGILFTIDAGNNVITTGYKGFITISYNAEITGWKLLADQLGSISIDIWKNNYVNYPPTVSDTITGTEKPILSSEIKAEDTNLTTWTTSVLNGDILAFNVDTVTSIRKVQILLSTIRV